MFHFHKAVRHNYAGQLYPILGKLYVNAGIHPKSIHLHVLLGMESYDLCIHIDFCTEINIKK